MDAKTTGAFIAALRRDKSMTQRQLAEALAVTDKAVSRWETGKGYPDVETLTALAETLGVTVGEILAGERAGEVHEPSTEAPAAGVAPPTYIYGVPPHIVGELYNKAVNAERRVQGMKTAIIAVTSVIASLIGAFSLFFIVMTTLNSVLSVDEECVIAADYSSINVYGQRYVPVELSHDVSAGDDVVSDPAVEGKSRWYNLFNGGTLYCVEGVPERELLYLSGVDGVAPSNVYCLESEVERITEYGRKAILDDYGIYGADRIDPRVRRICEAISSLDCKSAVRSFRSIPSNSLTVYGEDGRHIFKDIVGVIVSASGEYYFEPLERGAPAFKEGHRYMIPFPDSLDEDLDALFAKAATEYE